MVWVKIVAPVTRKTAENVTVDKSVNNLTLGKTAVSWGLQ